MVLSSASSKHRQKSIKDSLYKNSPKMAATSFCSLTQGSQQPSRLSAAAAAEGESDYDSNLTPLTHHSDIPRNLVSHFELLLTRTLKRTSDMITEKLTQEIREVDCRISMLEQKMDDLGVLSGNHSEELEILREENLALQARLEDFENRA